MRIDTENIIRTMDRRLKVRALRRFEEARVSQRELEQDFARSALLLMRQQPAMAELAGVLPGLEVDDEPRALARDAAAACTRDS